jgi:uncharacterized protein YegJ (DUF2314 family)
MKKCILLFMMPLAALQACSHSKKDKDSKYEIVNLNKDDRTFLALKDTAQAHINEFTESLLKHAADTGNYRFITKSDFEENGGHEHMWSQVSFLKDGTLQGTLIDSPFNIKRIKTYDGVAIKIKDVEDWVIYDKPHQRKIGDYSAKYLESKQ